MLAGVVRRVERGDRSARRRPPTRENRRASSPRTRVPSGAVTVQPTSTSATRARITGRAAARPRQPALAGAAACAARRSPGRARALLRVFEHARSRQLRFLRAQCQNQRRASKPIPDSDRASTEKACDSSWNLSFGRKIGHASRSRRRSATRSKSRTGFSTGCSLAFLSASSNLRASTSSFFCSASQESRNLSSRRCA